MARIQLFIIATILAVPCFARDFRPTFKHRILTASRVEEIKQSLKKDVLEGRKLARAVRLTFHDCVGGCNGCLNKNHPENLGDWLRFVQVLDLYYDMNFSKDMSRADYYVLAGIAAIEKALDGANEYEPGSMPKFQIPFTYGRRDCPTSPDSESLPPLPSGHANQSETFGFFRREFGLDREEAVALLGAHTLGGATGATGSGFQGFWKGTKENQYLGNYFNNGYYKTLLNTSLQFVQEDQSKENGFRKERWQWNGFDEDGKKRAFMLNTDVSLVKDIKTDDRGRSSCSFQACPTSADTLAYAYNFAWNPQEWVEVFSRAFVKMTNTGATRLLEPHTG